MLQKQLARKEVDLQQPALPNELKTEIASYLASTRDQKALTLVGRDWALVTLPILWETFYADQEVTQDRQLRALTDAGSNIIKHVKHLSSTYWAASLWSYSPLALSPLLFFLFFFVCLLPPPREEGGRSPAPKKSKGNDTTTRVGRSFVA
jgi:hypothetical protein